MCGIRSQAEQLRQLFDIGVLPTIVEAGAWLERATQSKGAS